MEIKLRLSLCARHRMKLNFSYWHWVRYIEIFFSGAFAKFLAPSQYELDWKGLYLQDMNNVIFSQNSQRHFLGETFAVLKSRGICPRGMLPFCEYLTVFTQTAWDIAAIFSDHFRTVSFGCGFNFRSKWKKSLICFLVLREWTCFGCIINKGKNIPCETRCEHWIRGET